MSDIITDPRQRGVSGLSGLKGLNQEYKPLSRQSQIKLSKGAAFQAGTNDVVRQAGLDYLDSGVGNSVYDKRITNTAELNNLGDFRASEQSGVLQVANGLAKGVVLAGTTFLDGTVGLLAGGAQAIAEGNFSKLWDNPFSNAMKAINDSAEKALPNYYSQDQLNNPLAMRNILSANSLGDKLLKNIGFTVGAYYSGSVWTKPLSVFNLIKNANVGAHIASSLGATISAVNEGRIEALNNSTDWYNLQKAQLDEELSSKMIEIEGLKGTPAYDELSSNLNADYINKLGNLDKQKERVGNTDLLFNLPILLASNLVEFGKLYSNGFKTATRLNNISGVAGEYKANFSRLGKIVQGVKAATSEGTEEVLQQLAANVSGNIYLPKDGYNLSMTKASIDNEAEQQTLGFMKAFAKGVNETMNEDSTWEQFMIGALTGALGMPTFGKANNANAWIGKDKAIGLSGGTVQAIRDYNQEKQDTEALVERMNARVQSPEFLNYYQGLIRHNKFQNDMNQAALDGREKEFKDAEYAQMISDISMFATAGRLDDYQGLLTSAFDTSDENLEQIAQNTTSIQQNEDGTTIYVGPFTDERGNHWNNISEEKKQEMVAKLSQSKNEMLKGVKDFSDSNEYFTSRYPSLSEDQRNTLVWLDLIKKNSLERANSIAKEEIKPFLSNYLSRAIEVKKYFEGPVDLSDRVSQDEVDWAIENLQSALSVKDDYLAEDVVFNSKFYKALTDIPYLAKGATLNLEKIKQGIDDIISLTKSSEKYQKTLDTYLANPEKITKKVEQEKKAEASKIRRNEATNLESQVDLARNFSDIRTTLFKSKLDEATQEKVLKSSKNKAARDFYTLNQKVKSIKDSIRGVETQTRNDVFKILDNILANAEELEDLDITSIVAANTDILREEDKNVAQEELQARLDKALSIIDRQLKGATVESEKGKVVTHNDDYKDDGTMKNMEDDPPSEVDEEPVTGNSESPAPKPIEVNMEGTKAPDVADTNLSYSKDSQGQVEYYIKDSETTPEDLNTVASSETAAISSETSKSGSIIPSSSQYDLTGMNTKDEYGNPKDVQFIPVAEAGQANHQYLSTNGPTQDAFNWVNKGYLARYKEKGGKLYFGIDPRLDSELPIVFVKDPDGQFFPVATLYKSKAKNTQYGLTAFYDSLLEEFKANPTEDTPYVSSNWESSVDEVMKGRIPYTTNQSRDIQEALVGAEINASNAELVVDADNEIIGTSNVSDYATSGSLVSGMSYIAVPNARRTTSFRGKTLVPVIPKFYREISEQGGEFTKRVNALLNQLAQNAHSSDTKRKVLEAFNALGNYLNLARVDIVIDKDIIIKEAILDEKGHKQFKTKDGREYIESKPILSISSYASNEEIIAAFKSAFSQVNVPIRVNKANVRERNYIKMMIEENLLKTFATSLKSEGAYFSMSSPVRLDSKDENPVEKEITREITGNPELTEDDYSSILASETVATPKVPKQEERTTEKTTPKVLNPTENSRKELTEEEKARLLKDHSQEWLDSASNEEILYALTCKGF